MPGPESTDDRWLGMDWRGDLTVTTPVAMPLLSTRTVVVLAARSRHDDAELSDGHVRAFAGLGGYRY
jgi:hypothetical protein